jgi:hypothetical protein
MDDLLLNHGSVGDWVPGHKILRSLANTDYYWEYLTVYLPFEASS